ncbi:MAG: S8 family serine peptidase [Pirellulales bacterium]|nr:S8 family serine peptidase [Pirellulales bacterium]
MRRTNARKIPFRHTMIERCEDRQMMAYYAFGKPDFQLNHFISQNSTVVGNSTGTTPAPAPQITLNPQATTAAHNLTGWSAVQTNYGLSGRGQTVAVIDSGIAADHPALGGGYGTNFRVVGGWDFAENDANPYDDGPAGSHGTHVAGIVGSSDANSPGVADNVDLVSLRVFDDDGNGYFSWVESALQWVYQNRNAYRNPITTVNLSLGADWNSSTIPSWANLEDEFRLLNQAGIFVAVAAGNSFGSYNTPGLSYPAVSSYVVPVMSVNSDGNMSNFSQRHQRAIAAPGAGIRSTVPDYMGNANGRNDDFATFSGTSMASPYVAGAATLIREAMLVQGYTGITQSTIYNLMMNTADSYYDSATQANYKRLNLQRAIDTVLAADDFGSTAGAAHGLGTIGTGSTFTGRITRLNDKDYFTFTAAATGTLQLSASVQQELALRWELIINGSTSTHTGNSASLSVVAGQTYTIGLSTTDGIGIYSITAAMSGSGGGTNNGGGGSSGGGTSFSPPPSLTNLGTVDFKNQTGINVNGEAWYGLTTSRGGIFTAEALAAAGTNLQINYYSASGQLLQTRSIADNNAAVTDRWDFTAQAGQQYYVRLSGTAANLTLRLTNLVSQSGSTLNVVGTSAADSILFQSGTVAAVNVNGVLYTFNSSQVNSFTIDAAGGADTVILLGTGGNDTVTLRPGVATLQGSGYTANVANAESITANGNGGTDTANFFDSSGDDTFYANSLYATASGTGFANTTNGFSRVAFSASTGKDLANLHDSAGNDTLTAYPGAITLSGANYSITASGFDATQTFSVNGGNDTATLIDSSGSDLFSSLPTFSVLMGDGFYNYTSNFDKVTADGRNGGYDIAYMIDSAGNDIFTLTSTSATLQGNNFWNVAHKFDFVVSYATGGLDTANLYDSPNNDSFEVDGEWGKFSGFGYYSWVNKYDQVNVYGTGGGTNTIARRTAAEFVFEQIGQWQG